MNTQPSKWLDKALSAGAATIRRGLELAHPPLRLCVSACQGVVRICEQSLARNFLFLLFFCLSLSATAGNFNTNGWRKSGKITVAGYTNGSALTSFPYLVIFTNGAYNLNYADFQPNASDLRFTDLQGDELNYDVERWNTSGNSHVWVKLTTLTTASNFFYAYWSNNTATTIPVYTTNGATWSNGYVGVWHMDLKTNWTLTATNYLPDVSTNINNGVATNETGDPAAMPPPTNAVGKIGNAVAMNYPAGRTNFIILGPNSPAGTNTTAALGLLGDAAYTAEAWVYRNEVMGPIGTDPNDPIFNFSSGPPSRESIFFGNQTNNRIVDVNFGVAQPYSTRADTGLWVHVFSSYDPALNGGTKRLYYNGAFVEEYSMADDLAFTDGKQFFFGRQGTWWDQFHNNRGQFNIIPLLVDEVRISGERRSEEWIQAQFMNMASNIPYGSFKIYGRPGVNNGSGASSLGRTTATLNGNLVEDGGTTTIVRVYWGLTDGGNSHTTWTYTNSFGTQAPASLSTNLGPLLPNTRYFYRFYATNFYGERWTDSPTGHTQFVTLPVTSDASNKVRIAFTQYGKSEILTNFPVSVALGTNVGGFDYADFFIPATGADLRFANSNESIDLKFEIESWSTTGTSIAWVQLPYLQGTDTFIYAYWHDPNQTSPASSSLTWDSNFRGVWHMKETSPLDSSTYGRNSTGTGLATTNNGRINGAVDIPIAGGQASWSGTSWTSNGLTIEAIVYHSSFSPLRNLRYISVNANAAGIYSPQAQNGTVAFANGSDVIETGRLLTQRRYHHVVGVLNGTTMSLYVDGVLRSNRTTTAISTISSGLISDSASSHYGVLDEVRVSSVARSSNWIWATWMNEASNTVFTGLGTVSDRDTLPFFDGFEEPRFVGLLNGQNFWVVTPGGGASIQTSMIQEGTNAVQIGTNAIVSHSFEDSGAQTVMVKFYAKIPRRDVTNHPGLSADAAIAFYINTNGHPVVYHGNNWVTVSNRFTVTNDVWHDYTVNINYSNSVREWDLYIGLASQTGVVATLITNAIDFRQGPSPNSFTAFRIVATNTVNVGYLDAVTVKDPQGDGGEYLLSIDADGDEIPDAWEYSFLGTTNGDGRIIDNDGDSWFDFAEYISGTDPDDRQSYLQITGVDLVNSTGMNVNVTIVAGKHTLRDLAQSTGIKRRFLLIGANKTTNAMSTISIFDDVLHAGTNILTDYNAVGFTSRFYSVAVSFGNRTYTNSVQWAMFAQPRPKNKRQLMAVPVNQPNAADNNLAGALGRQLGRGLYASHTNTTADKIEFLNAQGQWKTYYWMSNQQSGAVANWYDPDVSMSVPVSDVPIAPGSGFWVVRVNTNNASRTNTVMAGKIYADSDMNPVAMTRGTWNYAGWPLPDAKRQVNQGASTPTNAMGFKNLSGGTQPTLSHTNSGSQLYVWDGNGWKWYWLYDNHSTNSSTLNRRWWDPNSNTYANINLEPGMGFLLYVTTNWGTNRTSVRASTNHVWTPTRSTN